MRYTVWWFLWASALALMLGAVLELDMGLLREAALVLVGAYGGAEWLAVENREPRDTMSERVWIHVEHPMVRWALGILLAYIAGALVSGWLGMLLAVWLPLHLAVQGIEKKVFTR